MTYLAIFLVVLAVGIFGYCVVRGGVEDSGASYAVGVLTGLLLGVGGALLIWL